VLFNLKTRLHNLTLVLGDYDTGVAKALLSSVSGSGGSTPAITLGMRMAAEISGGVFASRTGWWHWAAQITNVQGKTPTFSVNIDDGVNAISLWAGGVGLPNTVGAYTYKAWFSYDQETWTRFDNTAETGAGTSNHVATFSHDTAFTGGVVYVRSHPGFPTWLVEEKVAALNGNALVSSTDSWDEASSVGAAKFKIGETTAVNDESSRQIPALNLYGFKISSGAGNAPDASDKRKVVLISGVHPAEHIAQWKLWGLVDIMLSGSQLATDMLSWADYYVYPCCNPAGVYGGYWRQDPHAPTVDCNRAWPAGTNTVEFINVIRPLISADVGAACHVFIDVHEDRYGDVTCIFDASQSAKETAWVAAMGDAIAATSYAGSFAASPDTASTMSKNWGMDTLGAVVSFIDETGPEYITSISVLNTLASIMGTALVTLFDNGDIPS
jgi:hypothetical protein